MSEQTEQSNKESIAAESTTLQPSVQKGEEELKHQQEAAADKAIDWKQVLCFLGLSWFMAATLLFAYHKLIYTKSRAFAVVDLNEIVNIKQLQFQQILIKSNVTDRDRTMAYEMVTELGKILPEKVEQLHQQCNCVILTKGAVIGGEALDLTENLKTELGLAGISSKSLKEQMNAEQSMATNKFEHP